MVRAAFVRLLQRGAVHYFKKGHYKRVLYGFVVTGSAGDLKMAAHVLHAPSELNLCFGVRTRTRAPWDSLNIEWRSFSFFRSLSLRKRGSGWVPV